MKKLKISILAILIITSLSANAQLFFGMKGGLNLSNLTTVPSTNNEIKAGFNLGLIAGYMLNDNIGAQTGLFYSTAGTKRSYKVEEPDTKFYEVKRKNLNTIQIPLHLAFKIGLTPDLRIAAHAGPYAAYIVSGNSTTKTTLNLSESASSANSKTNLYPKDGKHPLNRFDAGLGVGLGVEFTSFLIDLGVDFGLVNLSNIDKKEKEALKKADSKIPSTKTTNMYLSVGYQF